MKKVLLKGGMLIGKADGFDADKKDILMGMSFSFVGAEGFEPPTLCL